MRQFPSDLRAAPSIADAMIGFGRRAEIASATKKQLGRGDDSDGNKTME
jgi:hypothetical protein